MPIVIEQSAQGGGGGRLLPPGGVMYFAGSGAPLGYLIADGSSVPVATYPALFAQIGYTYGGAGANFNLPDIRGIALAGAGLGTAIPGLTNHVLGSFGGSETHTLTVGELATHTHLQNAHTHLQDAHTHTQNSHNHLQDSHNHTQDAHTHTQNSHNHTQDAHTHTQNSHVHDDILSSGTTFLSLNAGTDAFLLSYTVNGGSAAAADIRTSSQTATNQNTTATNQATTATNQNTTATNQATTATNQATTAVNLNTTATNQNTTAVNQNEGSSTPFSIIQPTLYLTPCIAY